MIGTEVLFFFLFFEVFGSESVAGIVALFVFVISVSCCSTTIELWQNGSRSIDKQETFERDLWVFVYAEIAIHAI